VVVAGQRIVLFRGKEQEAAALIDRCPHRGVALSGGHVDAGGAIVCPFHGWRFTTTGNCAEVPLNPQAKCERLGATALPVRELGGLVWIYTGLEGAGEPVLPEALADRRNVLTGLRVQWKAHWTRAMENMLDMPHLPYVHRTTIGAGLRRRMKPTSEMVVSWEPTENGGRITNTLDGESGGAGIEFIRPNAMVLHIMDPESAGGRLWRLHVYCVPAGPNEVRVFIVQARNFLEHLPFGAAIFNFMNGRIALQDQPVVESSDPPEVPPPGDEKSVASDRGTLQFRKYYYDVLRPSGS
jgi:phenylpropionate dioxygenase-like ring-hydroxylating dioxygenase large terminal subunit